MKKDLRPTFYFDNDARKPVRAGGVIFYKRDKYLRPLFLMQQPYILTANLDVKPLEDFGGKTDPTDTSFGNMIRRECIEESNGILMNEPGLKKLEEMVPIYSKKGKYLVYFIEVQSDYDPVEFGSIEFGNNTPRLVKWELHLKSIHIRLQFDEFYEKIKELRQKKYGLCEYVSNYFRCVFG
jgi:hypothetical protein